MTMTRADAPEITFTLDIEDHGAPGAASRVATVTRGIIDALAPLGVRGTMFVVGEVAAAEPGLVRDIVRAGHELALHGWEHTPLRDVGKDRLRAELRRGKDVLEQTAQVAVSGFRAPTFSLVPETHWALDDIVAAGFTYSSSVLPARSPLWGDRSAPRHPFRWPNGLVELPCPVATFGGVANPYLGGVYFRVLPWAMVRWGLSQAAADEVLWLYCHPYDFDPDEPFRARPELGRYGSRLMWLRRGGMMRRVQRALDGRAGPPLGERVATLAI